MLDQPLATGRRMFRDHSNQPAFASPGFLEESQGPQSMTYGSYSRPSFDHDYNSQMSVVANNPPNSRQRLHEHHNHKPPIADQTTEFRAPNFLGGIGAMEM